MRTCLIGALLAMSCASGAIASQPPDVAALIRALSSPVDETRIAALESLGKIGAASAPALPAVIKMMSRYGWNATELPLACNFLKMQARAAEAFPLLTDWMIASEGELHVFVCLEGAARAAGPAGVMQALRSSARVAKESLAQVKNNPDAMFDTTATTRRAYDRPFHEFGAEGLAELERALSDRDPYIRAEAAGFLAFGYGPSVPPSLQRALKMETNAWARHEIAAAIARYPQR